MTIAQSARKVHAQSKSDYRYWEARVKPRSESCGYYVQFQCHGERRNVTLEGGRYIDRKDVEKVVTGGEKRDSAKAAAHLYRLVKAHGWESGLKAFRGEVPARRSDLTLGEYLSEVRALGAISPSTMTIYTGKLRTLASGISPVSLPRGLNKYDHVNGGVQEWRRRVDSIALHKLSPEAISKWRVSYIGRHADNPAKQRSAKVSADSCIRAGRAVFSETIRSELPHLEIPEPIPFSQTKSLKLKPKRYISMISSPEALLIAGERELAGATSIQEWETSYRTVIAEGPLPDPDKQQKRVMERRAADKHEAYKVLVLGLCVGLRRGEIDFLQWEQVDLGREVIRIEATDCFQPKADSEGEIPLDPELVSLLKKWKSKSSSRFVVNGIDDCGVERKSTYRANRAHKSLTKWLKVDKGINRRNVIHDLRKEFGSLVCKRAGIYVASRLLRHSDIRMTAAIYTDDRGKVTSGLGSALTG